MTMLADNLPRKRPAVASQVRGLLIGTFLVAAVIYLAGLWQNLPNIIEADEPSRVVRAVRMAMNWDPNPDWFGHPGSTVFYPLAFLIYLWNAIGCGGSLLQPNPQLEQIFNANIAPFYVIGRLVSIAYGLLSIPLVFLVGRRLFGEWTALVAIWLSLTYTLVISNAQVARDDSAGLFFAMLSLWLCLRYHDHRTTSNRLLAGTAIGLAVASRYFMAAFVLPLLAAEFVPLWRQYRVRGLQRRAVLQAGSGFAAAFAGFALSTPFFFIHFGTALHNLQTEARSVHLGYDGLSWPGNFQWYVGSALPEAISWPQMLLALVGVLIAIRYRRHLQILLAAFVLAFLLALSVHPLHQQRWLIQIMPLLAMFAAEALVAGYTLLRRQNSARRLVGTAIFAVVVVLALAVPTYDMILFTIRQVSPSTRVQALHWMEENVPPGSLILQERYAFQNLPEGMRHTYRGAIGETRDLDEYRRLGVDYVVVTDEMYNRYFSEASRYPKEVAVYRELFTTVPLVKEFVPAPVRPGVEPRANVSPAHPGTGGGPVIRIYRLQGD